MLHLAQSQKMIKVVNDQFGCPTYAGDLALTMIKLAMEQTANGVYHYCGDVVVSWCEFAQSIFISAKMDVMVQGIPASHYTTVADRPANSVMDTERIQTLGIKQSNWQSRLNENVFVEDPSGINVALTFSKGFK